MDRIDWEKVTKGGKEPSGKDFQTCKIAGHAQNPGRQEGVQTVQDQRQRPRVVLERGDGEGDDESGGRGCGVPSDGGGSGKTHPRR